MTQREKNHPDFQLMDILTDDLKLAGAVLAVGDRARTDGYRNGWTARGDFNTLNGIVLFILGNLSALFFLLLYNSLY